MSRVEYQIHELAELAGISTRTLRYYDSIALLKPDRVDMNGYRIYGPVEVDRLQSILFYRELGFPLEQIKALLTSASFDQESALHSHLEILRGKKERLEQLIRTVEKSIAAKKGDIDMSDKEKFEGFKRKLVQENEEKYGEEVRVKYGDQTVDDSNAQLMGLTPEKYARVTELSERINTLLAQAVVTGDPANPAAQEACALHREWLGFFWKSYSKEAHKGLAQMYVEDERFRVYYDAIGEGCAEYFRDALLVFCG